MHDMKAFFKQAKKYTEARKADERMEQLCELYLLNQPFSLWADWEIQDAQRRKLASAWLALQWEGVADEMRIRDWVRSFSQSRWRRWSRRMGKGAGWLKNWISTHSTSASRSSKHNEMPRPLPL